MKKKLCLPIWNEKIKVEMEAPKGGEAEVNDQGIISWKLKLEFNNN